MKGNVTLVGAGPGDGGLITIKGMKALQDAEVVVYDRLVGREILEMMPAGAEKIDAGKVSSNHKIPQDEINRILLQKALEGKNVVRLKGGDSFLFGRGGEELELLWQNGINFCVIPGVTSAFAVPAYAGIPITHRDMASSVHVITAHAKAGSKLNIDFESYVKIGGTFVFLMGAANMKYIIDGFINAGLAKDTPCAVIEKGTLNVQKKYIGTAADILQKARDAKSPLIIVLGDVCALSDKYDWFSKQPLYGKTVIVTRPKDRAGTLSDKLRNLGAEVVECPCIYTKSMMNEKYAKDVFETIKIHDVIVFTSPTGVKTVTDAAFSLGGDIRFLGDKKVAAIGGGTAAELRKYGIAADFVPETYDGRNLGKMLAKTLKKGDKILLLRALRSGKTLNDELAKANISYTEIPVYETIEKCEKDLTSLINDGGADYVTFTSASTVRGFMQTHVNVDKTKFVGMCIGKTTEEEAKLYGLRTVTAKNADIASLCERIVYGD